jgi:hypothetical protein
MSQILSYDEFKYNLIEKHTYALVKAIENFHHYILGKHTQVKFSLPAVKFCYLKHIFKENLHIVLLRYKNMISRLQLLTQLRDEIYPYTWLNILN